MVVVVVVVVVAQRVLGRRVQAACGELHHHQAGQELQALPPPSHMMGL
jgi:hypothetical protein